MCGIVGVFGRSDSFELVIKGLNIIKYRGKDGYGIWNGKECFYSNSLSFEKCESENAIGHCLHAVVKKIKQPFKGNGIFAGNCEIYNWENLCSEHNIMAENDAELFFKLLEEFGVEKTLELADGDYAGSYFIDNKVYLFRDRIGVKPVWYSIENGFAFASERKVLKKLGYENVFELNPRELLIYNLNDKNAEFINLNFYEFTKNYSEYSILKRKLGGLLVNAVSKRIPDVKLGLLFSGAVDSSFIALILKKFGVDFTCYTCVVKGFEKEAEDLIYAKGAAEKLNLSLEVIEISPENIEKDLPLICRLIESNEVTKVAVSIPFFYACKKACENGVKVIISGLGADDLFGGYERISKGFDVNKECYHSLLNIYERDLYRDDVITMYNNIELRVPYLDRELIKFALGIDAKYKINENGNKFILRDLALDYGLDKSFAFRKKRATQYGGNFIKAIEKLSKKHGFESKSKYLASLYDDGNVKLVALFSSGKDSCYAMYIMKKLNYNIKCLVTINSKNKDSYMYHTPNVHLAQLQAEALGIPIIMQESSGEEEKELEDLREALLKARKVHNIEGVVCGAIFSTYQRNRVQRVAESLGLKVFTPLWHKNQEILLRELTANGFEVIISSIASDGLDEKWLGRKLDEQMINELVELNKKNGINVAFEGGEAESLVLNCPMFRKKLIVESASKIMDGDYCGIFKINKVNLADKNPG